MEDNTRQFNQVLAQAQQILQNAFGMELAELMTRAEREQHQQGIAGDNQQSESSFGIKKKG